MGPQMNERRVSTESAERERERGEDLGQMDKERVEMGLE